MHPVVFCIQIYLMTIIIATIMAGLIKLLSMVIDKMSSSKKQPAKTASNE